MIARRSLIIGLILIFCFSSLATAARPALVVGYSGEEWITGLEVKYNKRSLVGFLGYEEDYFSGLAAITSEEPRIVGYAALGRQAFLGNIKYQFGIHGGNLGFYQDATGENKLGVSGELMKLSGKYGYGVRGEINLFGGSRATFVPYLEYRGTGTTRAQIGLGTHPVYFILSHTLMPIRDLGATLYSRYDLGERFTFGAQFNIENAILLEGTFNTDKELGLRAEWSEQPFSVNLNWHEGIVQWFVSYGLLL